MKIYNLPRNSGKTTRLMYLSEEKYIPILVTTKQEKNRIIKEAQKYCIKIPEPLCPADFLRYKNLPNKVLVDEACAVLQELITVITNGSMNTIEAATITTN